MRPGPRPCTPGPLPYSTEEGDRDKGTHPATVKVELCSTKGQVLTGGVGPSHHSHQGHLHHVGAVHGGLMPGVIH